MTKTKGKSRQQKETTGIQIFKLSGIDFKITRNKLFKKLWKTQKRGEKSHGMTKYLPMFNWSPRIRREGRYCAKDRGKYRDHE